MNKKLLYGLAIPLFAIVLVAAVVYYTTNIDVTANISEPFVVSTIPLSFSGYATNIIEQDISITNNADGPLPATITWAEGGLVPFMMEIVAVDGVPITPVKSLLIEPQVIDIPKGNTPITIAFSTLGSINTGTLHLVQKDTNTWQPLVSGDTIDISYSISGDVFEYSVTNGVIPSGYELVYAMDKTSRFSDYATVKTVDEINSIGEGLPMAGDWNADCIESEDYCDYANTFDDYENCTGAKLWIIPTIDIEADGVLSWANMGNYYYETNLIEYSKETSDSIGTITIKRIEA